MELHHVPTDRLRLGVLQSFEMVSVSYAVDRSPYSKDVEVPLFVVLHDQLATLALHQRGSGLVAASLKLAAPDRRDVRITNCLDRWISQDKAGVSQHHMKTSASFFVIRPPNQKRN